MDSQVRTIPSRYRWRAQDIPEPASNKYLPNGGVSNGAKAVLRAAVTRLLEDLDRDFSIPPQKRHEAFDLSSEHGRIDHEIGRLRSVMLAVKNELGQRVAILCKRRNAMAPVNRLPPELAGIIMTHAIPAPLDFENDQMASLRPPNVKELRTMANVSTGWWHLVRSCPSLWTTIMDEQKDGVALKLRKSGDLPLAIIFRNNTHRNETVFLDLTMAHSARWRSANLRLSSPTQLDHVRGVLRATMMTLERLKVVYSHPGDEVVPLEIAGGGKLRYLDIRGVMLEVNSPALRTVQRLTFGMIQHVTPLQLFRVIAATVELRSLTIKCFGHSFVEDSNIGATNLQLPLQLASLRELEIEETASLSVGAFLKGISAENLSFLYLNGGSDAEESETFPFHKLIRPNGGLSILSRAIANSNTDLVTIRIDDDANLYINGRPRGGGVGQSDMISVQFFHVGWGLYLKTMEDFPEFARSLPPVELVLTIYAPLDLPISLDFLLAMPTITSINTNLGGETARRLFEDILSSPLPGEQEVIWPCPKLAEVRIGGETENDEWDGILLPLIRAVLHTREHAMGVELQKISVFREVFGPQSGSEWIHVI